MDSSRLKTISVIEFQREEYAMVDFASTIVAALIGSVIGSIGAESVRVLVVMNLHVDGLNLLDALQ